MISVIICCYNDSRFLAQALESVFDQTLSDKFFEVVLVNDGSTDKSYAVAKSYQGQKNYRCFSNAQNKGLVFSCNKGISLAQGEYIIRLDADDYLTRDSLARFYDAACRVDLDFAYSDRYEIKMEAGMKRRVSLSAFSIFKLTSLPVFF